MNVIPSRSVRWHFAFRTKVLSRDSMPTPAPTAFMKFCSRSGFFAFTKLKALLKTSLPTTPSRISLTTASCTLSSSLYICSCAFVGSTRYDRATCDAYVWYRNPRAQIITPACRLLSSGSLPSFKSKLPPLITVGETLQSSCIGSKFWGILF